ncbi:hypothetical protein BJX70DRAFT_250751 [Aspergillus crustosus]
MEITASGMLIHASDTKPSNMNSLPVELVILIAEHVNPFPKDKTLLHVCRDMRKILTPFIYRSVVCATVNQTRILAELAIENPQIAESVQELTFTNDSWQEKTYGLLGAGVRTKLDVMSISQPSYQKDEWHASLIRGSQDAWVGLLVACLPNLRILERELLAPPG